MFKILTRGRMWLLLFSMASGSVVSFAQDPHFSQYLSIPAVYNPAMTGMHDGIVKAALLYQDHLNFSNASIRKGVINLDYGKDLEVGNFTIDRIGVGGGVIYDDYNLGAFFNNSMYVNVAYLKSLSPKNNHKLGLGLQFHYSNRTVDYSRLTFGTQYLRGYYDATIYSGEIIGTKSLDYFDVQAGLTYHYISKFFKVKTGVAAFHLTQPESNVINSFKIPLSLSAFLSYETWFINHKKLLIDIYYRNKSMTISYFGGLFRYSAIDFGDVSKYLVDNYLIVGLNINSNLLVSPYIGWQNQDIEAGLTFDLKVADVSYLQYPFESFLEFVFSYKLNFNNEKIINIGGDRY